MLKFGIAQYNEACRSIVMKYSGEWEKIVRRLGRWIDMKNHYKTMDTSFMESVWCEKKSKPVRNFIYCLFFLLYTCC